MGEWSEYFEDFPEENPANHDKNGSYDPNGLLKKEREKNIQAHERLDELLKNKGIVIRPK